MAGIRHARRRGATLRPVAVPRLALGRHDASTCCDGTKFRPAAVSPLRRLHALPGGGATPCASAASRRAIRLARRWRHASAGGWPRFARRDGRHSSPLDGGAPLRHGRHYGCGNTPRPGAAARLAQRWRCHASPGNSGATPRRAAATDLARLQQAPPIGGSPGGSDTPCREAAARLARRRRCHASPGGGVNASPGGNATVRRAANRVPPGLDDPSLCKIGPAPAGRLGVAGCSDSDDMKGSLTRTCARQRSGLPRSACGLASSPSLAPVTVAARERWQALCGPCRRRTERGPTGTCPGLVGPAGRGPDPRSAPMVTCPKSRANGHVRGQPRPAGTGTGTRVPRRHRAAPIHAAA